MHAVFKFVPCTVCLHSPVVRKELFPIIEFIAFEDGFTPSGFWKHMLYNVTYTHSHSPLSLSLTGLYKHTHIHTSLSLLLLSIKHSNTGMHCENGARILDCHQ